MYGEGSDEDVEGNDDKVTTWDPEMWPLFPGQHNPTKVNKLAKTNKVQDEDKDKDAGKDTTEESSQSNADAGGSGGGDGKTKANAKPKATKAKAKPKGILCRYCRG